jgi:pyruvate ferredoxin oxidoreductase alpha subunit
MQFYAEDPQEVADLHICAYKIAEDKRVLLPAMVCMDGFLLSHVFEAVEIPDQETVDSFLPPYKPVHTLDPDRPLTMGAYADPQTYLEIRYILNQAMVGGHDVIAETAQQFTDTFGRKIHPFVEPYRMEDAETALIAMGSIAAVAKDAVDERRARGERVGVLRVVTFRPFPGKEIVEALQGVKTVGVLDKSISLGAGGPLAIEVRNALHGVDGPAVSGFILGLGGRDVSTQSIHGVIDRLKGPPGDTLFVDLDRELVGDLARTWEREWQPA